MEVKQCDFISVKIYLNCRLQINKIFIVKCLLVNYCSYCCNEFSCCGLQVTEDSGISHFFLLVCFHLFVFLLNVLDILWTQTEWTMSQKIYWAIDNVLHWNSIYISLRLNFDSKIHFIILFYFRIVN